MGAIFTVDLESWNHALHIPDGGHSSIIEFNYILGLLSKYDVKAIFYVLGKFSEEMPQTENLLFTCGHTIKSHGYYHYRNEESDRKPYAWLGFTGGFYFRLFPYWLIKMFVESSGHFYIHPHDLDKYHPKLKNPVLNWKRHVGLKQSRLKLERLVREVKWDVPR